MRIFKQFWVCPPLSSVAYLKCRQAARELCLQLYLVSHDFSIFWLSWCSDFGQNKLTMVSDGMFDEIYAMGSMFADDWSLDFEQIVIRQLDNNPITYLSPVAFDPLIFLKTLFAPLARLTLSYSCPYQVPSFGRDFHLSNHLERWRTSPD